MAKYYDVQAPLAGDALRERILELDRGLAPGSLVCALTYNLTRDPDGPRVEGFVAITEESVRIYIAESLISEMPIADITEFKCTPGIGVTSLECKIDGRDRPICRSDMSYQHEYAAVAKRLNIWLETGVFHRDYEREIHRICPKCGRPFQRGADICYHCVKKSGYVKRLWEIAKPFRPQIFASVVLFFVISAVNLLPPYLNKIMVDDYILKGDPSLISQFLIVIACIFGVNIATRLLSVLRSLLLVTASNKIIVRLRDMVFTKIQKLSISCISKRTAGDLMQRVNNDTSVVREFLTHDIGNIIEQSVILIAVGIILFAYDWRLALLIIFPMPIAVTLHRRFWRYLHRMYHKQWQTSAKADTILHDIFSGIRVVKAFGMEKRENERFDKAIRDYRDISMKNEQTYALINPIVNFIMGIGEFFMLYYFGSKVIGFEMTLGEMQQLSAYASLIYGPMYWMGSIPRRLVRMLTSVVKIFDLLDEKVDVDDKANARELSIVGDIEIDNISFGYDDTADVLKHVTARIKPGEMVGIVGKSGVGKSTLINLVMRLYDVNAGAIRIDGVDIRDISQESLRSQIGVVLQETFLFAGTIYDNIGYAKPGATRDEIITAAKAAGAHGFIMKLPDAYNTKVGERGHTLSGGERQRISIARALLHNPRILILDEATASLDTETEKQIQDSLQKLMRDRTTLAIAHRLSTLRNADKLIVLDRGTVAEFGTHEELLRKKGIYYGLVMAQRSMSKMDHKQEK